MTFRVPKMNEKSPYAITMLTYNSEKNIIQDNPDKMVFL